MTAGLPPLVLLPGMDGTGEFLTSLRTHLAPRLDAEIISYPPDEPLGYASLVKYVRERLPEMPFALLGESFSGPIAIEIAAHDQRVVGLALASSFARSPVPEWIGAFAGLFGSEFSLRVAQFALLGGLGPPELQQQLREVLRRLNARVIRQRMKDACAVDQRAALVRIGAPILCLRGKRDRVIGAHAMYEITRLQPSARVRAFDAPHMLLQTNTSEVAAEIIAFCQSLPVGA